MKDRTDKIVKRILLNLTIIISSVFKVCGKYIECIKSVLHLGHVLAENLQDDVDIKWYHSDLRTACYIDLLFVLLWFCLICCAAFVCYSMVVHCGI